MGRRELVSSIAVLALASGIVPTGFVHGPVQARDAALDLAPSSAWVLDYAADSCALRREFGGPDTPVVIELRQYAPDRIDFQVLAVSSNFRLKSRSTARNLAVRYLPDVDSSPTGIAFNMQPSNGMNGITFTSTLFPAQWESPSTDRLTAADRIARESEVVAIELVNAFRDDVVLTTGSLRAPMEAMRGCLDELLTHWGIDVEAHRQLASPVAPLQMEDWARAVYDVYPARMVRSGSQAILRIRMNVSDEGMPTSCSMQTRMGEEEFERTACEILMRRARFSPAIAADGTPIASYYILSVVYSMSHG
ncbi:energy transducer TonB [Altererythrobacter sp. KTW20L]|uniref:energy transducer TonB family protein n=1 Tax=Altererythrobacter sp. KTW20L TaxID=2942210 RepID=UPI0020C158DC|nr:energy transducer TonB [Altererythrobacter sp. KTW20L]MCL6249446.1 energy transducer TonB [Altererythrobacter sp. KTW20L]